ncbi:TPA_asm: hypothetical protein [Altiarchaeum virus]|nr:TPA_asm: hypothetical protein [Altiarchaeum virus]
MEKTRETKREQYRAEIKEKEAEMLELRKQLKSGMEFLDAERNCKKIRELMDEIYDIKNH